MYYNDFGFWGERQKPKKESIKGDAIMVMIFLFLLGVLAFLNWQLGESATRTSFTTTAELVHVGYDEEEHEVSVEFVFSDGKRHGKSINGNTDSYQQLKGYEGRTFEVEGEYIDTTLIGKNIVSIKSFRLQY